MKYNYTPKTPYEKQEILRRSKIVSHIINNNYTVAFSDKDLYTKIDDCLFDETLKHCFVFIGRDVKAYDKRLAYVSNALRTCDVKIKCWDITSKTNFVFLKRNPQEIYEELFSIGYINKSEYDYLIREVDSEITRL